MMVFKGTLQVKDLHHFVRLCMLISDMLSVFSYVHIYEILLEMLLIV